MAKNDKIEPETPQELEDKADRELLKEIELLKEKISNQKDAKKQTQGEKITENTNVLNAMFKAVMEVHVPQVKEIKKSVGEFQAFQQKVSDEISANFNILGIIST